MKTSLPNPNAGYRTPIYSLKHILRFVRAVRSPAFSHARCHSVSPSSLQVYHRDGTSPTGVSASASIDKPYGEAVLKRLALGGRQLSPTESQFSSHR